MRLGALNDLPIKPQTVRLFDVFVFGPLLLAAASRARPLDRFERVSLALIGAGTIAYNLFNYLEIERARRL
jgi:hypothetical protein